MPKFFVKSNQIQDNHIEVTGMDVNHIKNVLRLKEQDELQIANSDNGENFWCQVMQIEKEKIICAVIKTMESRVESNVEITIFQGIPKADKMELIIQKATELGVKEITPVFMKRCIAKIEPKEETKKLERWSKIAQVAAKQSGRDSIPTVNCVINIKKICSFLSNYDIVIVAYEAEKINKLRNEIEKLKGKEHLKIGIVIGPEGGIEKDEIEDLQNAGAKIVTLGPRILRTETVALVLSSILLYELEE